MSSTGSNDDTSAGQLTSTQTLSHIVESFPQEHLVHAFGYGSGVFSQTLGDKKHEGMLDMILVVDDAYEFHQANVQVYPHHYAPWLKTLGPSTMSQWQRNFLLPDARVLFHVVDDPVPMKYGVVHVDDLVSDLRNWDTLYLAGRLHKPTLPISTHPAMQEQLDEAQTSNLQAAVAAALLSTPPTEKELQNDPTSIPWLQFYSQIAGLSYTGDFRMQVGGEDPLKINKLVQASGQLERFQSLYQPILEPLEQSGVVTIGDNEMEWNSQDPSARQHLRQQLPPSLATASSDANIAKLLASIVAPAARHQSLKGIFTLGLRRSLQYASAKLSKGLFRNFQ